MNIKHKIVNLDNRDYHMHTTSFSDGLNTIDELVKFAGDIGLTEIAITDHSDAAMESLYERFKVSKNAFRYMAKNWGNVHNDVSVIFGVEADILNEHGDISDTIQGHKSEFVNLSAHIDVYKGTPESINIAYKKAIEKYHKNIKCICHPCSIPNFGEVVDIVELVKIANIYGIGLELNAKYLYGGKTNLDKLHYLLQNTDKIYINSDAHCLYDLKETRKFAIEFLRENNYIDNI